MVKVIDTKEREADILRHVVECYIEESRPVSSSHLCEKYRLEYSSATVRNVMVSLEKQGLLAHTHTSSGRVPTKAAFKRYAEHVHEEDVAHSYPIALRFDTLPRLGVDEVMNYALDMLTQYSGYASMVAISGRDERVLYKGIRYIVEQPEFEDVQRLKDIFYLLEVRMAELEQLLFTSVDDHVSILIGDDIGFKEISNCSLVISGVRKRQVDYALALLGPMRMHYAKAVAYLYSVCAQLNLIMDEVV